MKISGTLGLYEKLLRPVLRSSTIHTESPSVPLKFIDVLAPIESLRPLLLSLATEGPVEPSGSRPGALDPAQLRRDRRGGARVCQ